MTAIVKHAEALIDQTTVIQLMWSTLWS